MLRFGGTVLLFTLALICGGTAQTVQSCQNIADSALRLKCFDELAAQPKPKSRNRASDPGVRAAGWHLEKKKDQMTDKTSCVIYHADSRYIQVSPGSLYVSYQSRGGVQGFRYRIDDTPATGMQLPDSIEKKIGVVHIKGPSFEQILSAKRLRIEVLTYANGIQNEDIRIEGLRPLYQKMIQECG